MSLEKIEEREDGVHLRKWEGHGNTVTITLTEAVDGPRLHAAMHAFSRTLAAPPSQPGGEAERRWYAVSHTDGDYTVQDRAGGAGQVFATFLAKDHGDRAKALAEMVAQSPTLLAQRDALERERDDWRKLAAEYQQASDTHFAEAEASEQKLAEAVAKWTGAEAHIKELAASSQDARQAMLDTIKEQANANRALEQRLSAALGDVEKKSERVATLEGQHAILGDLTEIRAEEIAGLQALLRRVVGAVEPFAKRQPVSALPDVAGYSPIGINAGHYRTLAALRTEALALLPPSGDVEGEGT